MVSKLYGFIPKRFNRHGSTHATCPFDGKPCLESEDFYCFVKEVHECGCEKIFLKCPRVPEGLVAEYG
jgi:hypothetical protein